MQVRMSSYVSVADDVLSVCGWPVPVLTQSVGWRHPCSLGVTHRTALQGLLTGLHATMCVRVPSFLQHARGLTNSWRPSLLYSMPAAEAD